MTSKIHWSINLRWWLHDPGWLGWNLSRFVGIPAVLSTLHKLCPATACEKFHPGKAGSFFFNAGILLCQDEILPCNCFSLPKGGININLAHAYKGKLKESVNKSKLIPGGKLSCLASWMKFDFPCNCRVKSVPARQIEISSQQTEIM